MFFAIACGVLHELRPAVRLLLQSRAFSAIAIVSLALGIGANSAMFSFVHAVLLNPLPYSEPERLVVLREHVLEEPETLDKIALANYLDWKAQTTAFATMAAYADSYAAAHNLTGAGESERVRTPSVTPGFFATLGVSPVLGRELEDGGASRPAVGPRQSAVLLSYQFWLRKFGGNPNVIGSTIMLSGEPHTVVGVLPGDFRFGRDVELWRQFDPHLAVSTGSRTNRGWLVVARLRPVRTIAQAQTEVDAVAARLALEHPRENGGRGARVVGLRDDISRSALPPLGVLYAAVCVLVLIACANVAGLLLARLATRQREIGVRIALGASRRRIARQLLAESLLLAVPAAALGLLVASWLVDAMVAIAPADLPRLDEVTIDGGIVAFTTALSVACATLVSLVPLSQAWRVEPRMSIGGGRSITPASARARATLLVGQVALSLVLLVGAGLLLRSYQQLGRVDPGFSADGVASIELAPQSQHYFAEWDHVVAFYERVLAAASAVPGVRSVAVSSLAPLAEGQFDERIAPTDAPLEEIRSEYRFISPGYFSTLRIALMRGRDFSPADTRRSTPVVILGQSTAARLFGPADPLGRHILLRARKPAEVVGVVADTSLVALHAAPPLQVYVPFPQADVVYWTGLDVLIRSVAGAESTLPLVRQRLLAVDAAIPPYNARTLDGVIATALAPARMWASMLTAFAVLAVLLACVGLYGLMSSVVVQRARELAIRLALGATSRGLAALVLRDAAFIVAGGLVLGTAVAVASSRVLQSLLFEISPTDWPTFIAVALLLIAVGLVASLAPVRRAMRVDPVVALRQE